MKFLEILFLLPGFIFLVSGLPQTYRLLKNKKSGDISLLTYGLTMFGIFLVFLDALLSKNYSIVWSNGVSLLMIGVNFFLVVKYRKN